MVRRSSRSSAGLPGGLPLELRLLTASDTTLSFMTRELNYTVQFSQLDCRCYDGGVVTRAPPRGRVDKRRAILDAAAEVFGTQGYERASIDAIAAASGVSKPTIYSHFGTKEQLFRESIAESAAEINSESMTAITALDVRR